MSTDMTNSLPGGRKPDWRLPDIVAIATARIPFKPPQHRHFRSALADFKEAIEFLVDLDGPVPARGEGPALYVGDVRVTEAERIDDSRYRFLAFDIAALKPGTPIEWGWSDARADERQKTGFAFEPPR